MADRDEFVKKQIQNLNKHLPKARCTLEELLKQEKPRIESRDGSTHRFKRSELEYLSGLVPSEDHSGLKLPIIIRISPQLGRGAAKVSGEIEEKVVMQILGKEGTEDELVIYRPEVRQVRKKLPTTTQYAFMVSSSSGGPIKKTR